MRNVLADLALGVGGGDRRWRCASRAPWTRARATTSEAALARIVTAIGKYWVCKRCPPFVNEAQECLGGNGYVEDSIAAAAVPAGAAQLHLGRERQHPVPRRAARARARSRRVGEAFFAELDARARRAIALARRRDRARCESSSATTPADLEERSRRLVERMAMALQAAVLDPQRQRRDRRRFCESRLGWKHGFAFGTLPSDAPFDVLVERAFPE